MMFTMVFIIAIFAVTTTVEDFRVGYISLPWAPEWGLNDRFLLFPAWICAYICMSAPLGRVVDRHIKLLRYRNYPLVTAAETIPEPLLHLVQGKKGATDAAGKRRQERVAVAMGRASATMQRPLRRRTSWRSPWRRPATWSVRPAAVKFVAKGLDQGLPNLLPRVGVTMVRVTVSDILQRHLDAGSRPGRALRVDHAERRPSSARKRRARPRPGCVRTSVKPMTHRWTANSTPFSKSACRRRAA